MLPTFRQFLKENYNIFEEEIPQQQLKNEPSSGAPQTNSTDPTTYEKWLNNKTQFFYFKGYGKKLISTNDLKVPNAKVLANSAKAKWFIRFDMIPKIEKFEPTLSGIKYPQIYIEYKDNTVTQDSPSNQHNLSTNSIQAINDANLVIYTPAVDISKNYAFATTLEKFKNILRDSDTTNFMDVFRKYRDQK